MKKRFVRICFCGTPDEYDEGKRIHIEELKVYRKRWYYILGILLTVVPMVYLLMKYKTPDVWMGILSITIGDLLIRDTISEHYVVKLLRGKNGDRSLDRAD